MLVHHAVTLVLIVASWHLGIPETGAVVLWLHAASDIFIDLLKAADAISFDAALAPVFALALIGCAFIAGSSFFFLGDGDGARLLSSCIWMNSLSPSGAKPSFIRSRYSSFKKVTDLEHTMTDLLQPKTIWRSSLISTRFLGFKPATFCLVLRS